MMKGQGDKMGKFEKIVKDIKSVKIQGATEIAKSALKAYFIIPTEKTKKKLVSLRPTEPLLANVMKMAGKKPKKEIISHLADSEKLISKNSMKVIKNKSVIFTHCHSTTVVGALAYAKKHGKKFEVYNTETRPLYQGRKTANDLRKERIKVTFFVDSGMHIAIKKADAVILGADALLKKGIINKIGSNVAAEIARNHRKPLYIFADSWKFYPKSIRMEERDFHEVWKRLPKKSRIKVMNPAFEFVPKKYITKIVSELGVLSYDKFLQRIKKDKR